MPTGVGLKVKEATLPSVPRFVADVVRRVNGSLDLSATLEQIADSVVELLGFGVACLNLAQPDGRFEVVTVAGPQEARQILLGTSASRAEWDAVFETAEERGLLRFLPFDSPALDPSEIGITRWVPSGLRVLDEDAWHPGDELFAPLLGADGTLLGILSVDDPPGGRFPDGPLCELLEVFVVHAALAVDNARLHARLARQNVLLRCTFEQSPLGMAVFGPDRRLQHVNPAFCALFGRTPEELHTMSLRALTHPEECEPSAPGAVRVDRRYVHADGHTVWGRLSLTPLDDRHMLAQLEDATAAREVERRATTDALTGLANRTAVLEHLQRSLHRGPVALLYCDVDDFKQVNDRLGHGAGDDLLVEIARNLEAVLRPGDRAGRLGGDEFVVVLPGVDHDQACEVAERVRKASRRALDLGTTRTLTTMTIGVALGLHGTADALLSQADAALLRAKREGRDRVVVA